jgi:hypothetical protein
MVQPPGTPKGVVLLSVEISAAFMPPQFLFGTNTVPSGATRTCPWIPPHEVKGYIGTAAPKSTRHRHCGHIERL